MTVQQLTDTDYNTLTDLVENQIKEFLFSKGQGDLIAFQFTLIRQGKDKNEAITKTLSCLLDDDEFADEVMEAMREDSEGHYNSWLSRVTEDFSKGLENDLLSGNQ